MTKANGKFQKATAVNELRIPPVGKLASYRHIYLKKKGRFLK